MVQDIKGYSSVDGLNATVVPHRIPPHVPFSMAPSKEAGMLGDSSAAENVFLTIDDVFILIILLSQLIVIRLSFNKGGKCGPVNEDGVPVLIEVPWVSAALRGGTHVRRFGGN